MKFVNSKIKKVTTNIDDATSCYVVSSKASDCIILSHNFNYSHFNGFNSKSINGKGLTS